MVHDECNWPCRDNLIHQVIVYHPSSPASLPSCKDVYTLQWQNKQAASQAMEAELLGLVATSETDKADPSLPHKRKRADD